MASTAAAVSTLQATVRGLWQWLLYEGIGLNPVIILRMDSGELSPEILIPPGNFENRLMVL